LTPKCATEVHRVMKERAMEVELNPDLEAACRPSLGSYCSEGEATKNIEFICLQGKYQDMVDSGEEHDAECAGMVSQLTGIASEDLDLEQVKYLP
jgi:Golgi apparatus protein 1